MRWIIPLSAAGVLALFAWLLWPSAAPLSGGSLALRTLMPVLGQAGGEDPSAFAETGGDWEFSFPRDHGVHERYRTELWDLSGLLTDTDGRRHGLRLTFVRFALQPPDFTRDSAFGAGALVAARLSLLPEDGEAVVEERLSRDALGLAGASVEPTAVWAGDWRLSGSDDGGFVLNAQIEGRSLTLSLTSAKAPVGGDRALLPAGAPATEGADPGFHFYLQSRLAVSGELAEAGAGKGAAKTVSGSAWLDHAWGSTAGALSGSRGRLALNRFALQLGDGTELMCLQLRRRAGGGTPIPTCLYVGSDGEMRRFARRDLTLEPEDGAWASPIDGTAYPLAWRLAIPALALDVAVRPLQPDQELMLIERLWSGAVTLSGRRGGRAIDGVGRMDLSGYALADDG
ncbi:MAG: hypothetical protein K9L70_13455 [Thiohalocapsa sp.]|nr:hypothetical protein [Thiohalocapsa sp.]